MKWTTCFHLFVTLLAVGPNIHSYASEQNAEEQNICLSAEGTVCDDNDNNDDSSLSSHNHEVAHENLTSGEDLFQEEIENENQESIESRRKAVEKCRDDNNRCGFWALDGECEANPLYMLNSCKRSCKVCSIKEERLSSGDDAAFGEPQEIGTFDPDTINQVMKEMKDYMAEIASDPSYDDIWERCMNRHTQCAQWVARGECDANPSYMRMTCAPLCKSCDALDFSARCPRDESLVDALLPGDLHRMFERIVADNSWNTTILSRPSENDSKPWVITIDDFVSEEECEKLIVMGAFQGYERSVDVGGFKFDGTLDSVTSSDRTSHNAWCSNECYNDPVTVSVMNRISNLTGVPVINSEHFQLLRYRVGQYYKTHHDYISTDKDRNPGPRILTAYMYLNDVEKGGGTNFPELNVTVMPRRGRLLLWPSVLNDHPDEEDSITMHQALPVEAGEKYGANGWLHLRDFVGSLDSGCA